MRYPQATCAWCGKALAKNALRMRLHETSDSSVRHTRMVASFHPDCGRELVDHCETARAMRGEVEHAGWTWAAGPGQQRMAAAR